MRKYMKVLKSELKRFREWLEMRTPIFDQPLSVISKMTEIFDFDLSTTRFIVITETEEIFVDMNTPENVMKIDFDKVRYIAKQAPNEYSKYYDSVSGEVEDVEIIEERLKKNESMIKGFDSSALQHWTTDETVFESKRLNDMILQGQDPMEYSLEVIKYNINKLKKFFLKEDTLNTQHFNYFDLDDMSTGTIFLKNHRKFDWHYIEFDLCNFIIPDINNIERVQFSYIPYKDISWHKNDKYMDRLFLPYSLDSAKGIGIMEEVKCHFVFPELNYKRLFRWYNEIEHSPKGSDRKWYREYNDAFVGALVAEQVLMSNDDGNTKVQYSDKNYSSKVSEIIPDENIVNDLFTLIATTR